MRSGFLNLPFVREESVMADKGFTVLLSLEAKVK